MECPGPGSHAYGSQQTRQVQILAPPRLSQKAPSQEARLDRLSARIYILSCRRDGIPFSGSQILVNAPSILRNSGPTLLQCAQVACNASEPALTRTREAPAGLSFGCHAAAGRGGLGCWRGIGDGASTPPTACPISLSSTKTSRFASEGTLEELVSHVIQA